MIEMIESDFLNQNKKEFFVLDLIQGNTGTDEIGKYLWCFNIDKTEDEIDLLTLWYLYHVLEQIAQKIIEKNNALMLLEEIAQKIIKIERL